MALAPAQRLKKRVRVGSAKKEKERERGGEEEVKVDGCLGPTSTRSLPRPLSYLDAVDPSTGLPRRASLALFPLPSSPLPVPSLVKHFLIACAFLMSLGLLAFSALGGWAGGGGGCKGPACQRGLATMCTHFIHQCAAAQNDGNAKTNDDVCLSSLVQREREGGRTSERVACLPGGRNRLFWS